MKNVRNVNSKAKLASLAKGASHYAPSDTTSRKEKKENFVHSGVDL